MDVTTWTVMAAVGAGATRKLATDPLHGTGLVPMAAVAARVDRSAVFPESGEPLCSKTSACRGNGMSTGLIAGLGEKLSQWCCSSSPPTWSCACCK